MLEKCMRKTSVKTETWVVREGVKRKQSHGWKHLTWNRKKGHFHHEKSQQPCKRQSLEGFSPPKTSFENCAFIVFFSSVSIRPGLCYTGVWSPDCQFLRQSGREGYKYEEKFLCLLGSDCPEETRTDLVVTNVCNMTHCRDAGASWAPG